MFIEPVDTVFGYLDVPADNELSVHLDVQNASENTLVLMATRLYVDTVSPYNYPYATGAEGAYDRFCWGPLCYNYGTDASSSTNAALLVTLAPGAINTSLVTDYYHNGVVGTSTLRYCLHEVGQAPESGSCHDMTFVIGQALSVEQLVELPSLNRVAEGLWNYDLAGAGAATFQLMDLMGRVVFEQSLNAPSGQITLPSTTLPTATYVVVLSLPNGARTTESVFFRGR